jgi:hypothetical protein
MMLGDLQVVGGQPPAKLVKALAVIAHVLHPAFSRLPFMAHPDKSKESCVLSSLTVRDFLWKIGFREATVAPVYVIVRALDRDGREIHSVGCGDHAAIPIQARVHGHVTDTKNYWSGHLVVLVKGWLIDPTLYQANRKEWPELPGMVAAPVFMDERGGMVLVSGSSAKRDDGSEVLLSWWAQPHNRRWKDGGDAKKERRVAVVKELVKRFGNWKES